MDKERQRQLILSFCLIGMILITLVLWYRNFVFHTYITQSRNQYCFKGENDDFMIDGYELYKDGQDYVYGGARLVALQDHLLLENDIVKVQLSCADQQGKEYQVVQQLTVHTSHEVCFLSKEVSKTSLNDIENPSLTIIVERNKKVVYQQDIPLYEQSLTYYNGANKDYMIQNIYVTPTWLKTGDFSSKIKDIEKKYRYMTIDYLVLKENGNEDNIDDYDRFAYLKGSTDSFLNHEIHEAVFYDDSGSLLDKQMRCVVTLFEDENDEDPYVFMLKLHGVKAVENNG